jgi:hypothetical protein
VLYAAGAVDAAVPLRPMKMAAISQDVSHQ